MNPPRTHLSNSPLRIRLDDTLVLSVIIFVINSTLMIWFFDPWIQGWGDSVRGFHQFNRLFFDGRPEVWVENQVFLRIWMATITLALMAALIACNLVQRDVAIIYFALPSAAYFASKIKVEFLLFPLCMIRTDLRWWQELLVISGILAATLALGENNGIIIVIFRVMVRVFTYWRVPNWIYLAGLAVIIIVLDHYFSLLYSFAPDLKKYEWTRDVVNPDYSIIETSVVFLSSMVLSINPQTDFPVGLFATAIVLFSILPIRKGVIHTSQLRQIWWNPNFRALVLTVVFFTSATHAFQNARYYFFFVIVFALIAQTRGKLIILGMSIPTTVAMIIYYVLVVDPGTLY